MTIRGRGRIGELLISAALLAVPVQTAGVRSASPVTGGLPACTAMDEAPAASAAAHGPGTSTDPAGATGAELVVFGAASLRDPFEAFAPTVRAETGIAPVYSFDASSALRAQIEQGAPADVFASADIANVVTLLDSGAAMDAVVFACNQLTVIVPAANPAGILSAFDLGRPGVKVVAAGDEVPITRYAEQLAANLGITDAYGANIVSREDNVAAVRSRIELGEGDAAIVYLTDAIASDGTVEQVPVPPDANVAATYAAAVVASTDQRPESAAFLGWLTGADGQAALGSFGFLPAP